MNVNIKKSKKGFSLVELLVVVTIIAILSVTAFVALGGQTVRARDARRQQDLATIQSALELYFLEFNRYPSALLTGLANDDGADTGEALDWQIPKRFLSKIPQDPNSKPNTTPPHFGTKFYLYASLPPGYSSYEIAATLEVDGNPANYRTYVVGNADPSIITTLGSFGKWLQNGALTSCAVGTLIVNGKIRITPPDSSPANANGTCIPYDPQ